jgi:hypothetical protein
MWQRKVKRRPLVRLTFRPGAAAVPGDDAAHNGQADAGARKLFGPVQALEYAEAPVSIGHIEADTVVVHILMHRLASRPSITGIRTSIQIKSGHHLLKTSTACLPSTASCT